VRTSRDEIDELIRQYADSSRSDTFVSYNHAIVLAREVRRLRRAVQRLKTNLMRRGSKQHGKRS
jgi:hypothetical protein